MRHQNRKYKIGGDPANRKSVLRNLAISMIEHGKIKTTHPKCKAMQAFFEKIVTIAKNDSVANRRLVLSKLNNRDAVNKLFKDVAPKFVSRPGGYTRITKIADTRVGDGAKLSYISLVE